MRDVPVASDLSFQVFQKRLSANELVTPELNDQNRRLFGLPSQVAVREAFIASRETIHDARDWEIERQRHKTRG